MKQNDLQRAAAEAARRTALIIVATAATAAATTGLYALAANAHADPRIVVLGIAAAYIGYIAALRLILWPLGRRRPARGDPDRRAAGQPVEDEPASAGARKRTDV
jgi:hypothetical protein